jgi:hypothetical protein
MSTQGFCTVLAAGCMLMALAGESPFVGTWKLNVEKSKLEGIAIDLGSTTARVEPDGAGLRGTVEITTPQGQIYRYSYPITLDGRPIKVTGTPEYDEIETRRVDDRTFTAICKKDGAVVFTERRAVSRDGKSITITRKGTNPQGLAYTATFAFDKL